MGANRLLLIAIGEYRHWASLHGPARDAEALKRVLYARYGFAPEHTVELRDAEATCKGIVAALRSFLDGPAADPLLIYYSGHGYTDRVDDTGYWIPHDGELDPLERRGWLPNLQVRNTLAKLPSRHVLVCSDSCFSGDLLEARKDIDPAQRAAPDFLERARRLCSREVLTSGSAEAVPDVGLGGHSPFAYHLIRTLEQADEPWLDVQRLHEHVRAGVADQSPRWGSLPSAGHQDGGAFLFEPRPTTGRAGSVSATPAGVSAPAKAKCPLCGVRNPIDDTFECRVCRRDYFCREHLVKARRCCEECAEKAETAARQEAERQARRAALAGLKEVPKSSWARVDFSVLADGSREAAERQHAYAHELGLPLEAELDLGNGQAMRFRLIPPGEFLMGQQGVAEPVHPVTITRGFWLGRYPVTQAQWQAVMGRNPSTFQLAGPDAPVENASWDDCLAFLAKLSALLEPAVRAGSARASAVPLEAAGARSGRGTEPVPPLSHLVFRLPTEAEWEYSCRAGTTGDYAGDLDALAWYGKNSGRTTHPVGQKAPNGWGLHDMYGNIWEWCQDWYDDGYYARSAVPDPVNTQTAAYRVVRGGGWIIDAGDVRSAGRCRDRPDNTFLNLGFRACLAPQSEGR